MQLQLLDFDKFIQANKVMRVKSYKLPSTSYDEDGLWSESIFGQQGSRARMSRFGYIDLKNKFIHPALFKMISTVSEQTSKIIRNKGFYIVEDGKYVESSDGKTGTEFLIESIPAVKFTKFCHKHKKEIATYLDKTEILIDKFLVQPAGLRDIDIYDQKSRRNVDEINSLYTKLLIYIEQLTDVPELDEITNKKIQIQLNTIYEYMQDNRLKGKKGLFRGTMLMKTLDYTSRLVLTNDPDVPLGKIGLPWHTLSAIYEPFMIHYIFKRNNDTETIDILKNYTNNDKLDHMSFSKLNREITNNPDAVPEDIKSIFVDTLEQFLPDQTVMVKRDPVQQRNNWFSATPIIMDGRVAYVNSLDLGPIGGDCIKGNVITYTKNKNGNYIQHIESIDEFYKNHKLKYINTHTNSFGVDVYNFLVLDEIYSLGIGESSETLEYSKISKWSIHDNVSMSKMKHGNDEIIISNTKSCYVYDNYEFTFKKLNINELNNSVKFLKRLTNKYYEYISLENIQFEEYIDKDKVTIKFGDIEITNRQDRIAYDFTMLEQDIRSFSHESGFIQCNSDGDTVGIYPVFTKEAKEEVAKKMNASTNKNKWISPLSYGNIIYEPTLDAISSVYNATRS